jgi:hypothetical protein
MARLEIVLGERERSYELAAEGSCLGTEEGSLVRLKGEHFAPRHCRIFAAEGRWRIEDLGSSLGTKVNGAPVSSAVLEDGDRIAVGRLEFTFRDAPPASARPAPARPGTRSGTRRRSRSRARGTGRSDAAGPLVRRRLRASRGLPTPILIVLLVVAVGTSGYVVYRVMSAKRADITGLIAKANEARVQGDFETAGGFIRKARDLVEPSSPHFDYVQELYAAITQHQQIVEDIDQAQRADQVYYNSLVPYYEKYVDTDDEQFRDDPATARYFVEYRLKPYLERFSSSSHRGTVQAWIDRLRTRYDPEAPFPEAWWDYEVIATHEERLERYGESYRVLNLYLERNPEGKQRERCEGMLEACVERAVRLWEGYLDVRLQGCLDARPPNLAGALTWAKKSWVDLGGIPELRERTRERIAELERLAAAQNVRLDLSDFQ